MQTVPSLVGTGTCVAAATTGLAFGQPADDQFLPPSSSNLRRRRTIAEQEHTIHWTSFASPIHDEPGEQPPTPTDQTRVLRRSSHVQITPPKSAGRPHSHSYTRQGDLSAAPITEDPRDSYSSNGSWMRRWSIRPLSQHDSLRSSVGPDSPSIFSRGSAAPILSPHSEATPQLPPNKLVKRSLANNGLSLDPPVRRGSRSHMPTIRRPATSHQRSATLQRMTEETGAAAPKVSYDQRSRPRSQTLAIPPHAPVHNVSPSHDFSWSSFFHARLARFVVRSSSLRHDSAPLPNAKRICVESSNIQTVYLVSPRLIMGDSALKKTSWEADTSARVEHDSPQSSRKSGVSPGTTPPRILRRSASMHFNSPSTWLSRTGSIRRRKRGGPDLADGDKRYASDPTTASSRPTGEKVRLNETYSGAGAANKAESELVAIFQPPSNRTRSTPSPLPPLSAVSSFHIDLNRLGLSSSDSQTRPDEVVVGGANATGTSRMTSNTSQARTLDRASTVGSSEYHRGFTSGDDDDTDTPFDSLRTMGSGRRRTLDSPLESMFDESPPSTAGNNKPKRLSIQEILGPAFDGGNRIMEEDEGFSTPVHATFGEAEARLQANNIGDNDQSRYDTTSRDSTLNSVEMGRLSLDEEDDFTWAQADEIPIVNYLAPPISMKSRRRSPNVRMALTNINGNTSSESHHETNSQRPRSNIFDWAEPTYRDKSEGDGHLHRPKTVHGKNELDIRGGRSASRKVPTAIHVRSQSVPVVPDLAENSKTTPKFGTWGLGTKNVSEDWDDDFEFDEDAAAGSSEGKKAETRISMVVPASIQATQPSVKAHSGQIRELSLLVNDLKRLCRLGREMDLLNGTSVKHWREAEGIIALASPDEDESAESFPSSSTADLNPPSTDQRFVDSGFDGSALDQPIPAHGVSEQMRTAVVKERSAARRRSVFSPEDDIFGGGPLATDGDKTETPSTPEQNSNSRSWDPSFVAMSLMESMQLRRRQAARYEDDESSAGRLDFDTNSLKELVKRASDLRDALSDLVRKADHIAQSPAWTPRRDRAEKNDDGSPAFTRVFEDPASTPSRRLPRGHRSSGSITASPSNGLSQRVQMMTVN